MPNWEVVKILESMYNKKKKESSKHKLAYSFRQQNAYDISLSHLSDSSRIIANNILILYSLCIREKMDQNRHLKYHNSTHILNMLKKWITLPEHLITYELGLAILYHDIVYNVKPNAPGENELLSKRYFEDHYKNDIYSLKENYDIDLPIDSFSPTWVQFLILKTDSHLTFSRSDDEHVNALMDLDLMGFGTNDCFQNSVNIVAEYLSEPSYDLKSICEGRKKFLLTMLQKNFIYSTDLFRYEYEEKARANMNKEIVHLELLLTRLENDK